MSSTANIRVLQVLPSRSTDLCFSGPGVIATKNFDHVTHTGSAHIGQPVVAYDPATQLYAHFDEKVTDSADPRYPDDPAARLKYDSAQIHKALTLPPERRASDAAIANEAFRLPPERRDSEVAPFLFALRNESLAAALDQAITRREGIYFERFKHGPRIQQEMTNTLPVVIDLLARMQREASDRFDAIDAAYAASRLPPVITSTKIETSVSDDYKVHTKVEQRNTISVGGEYDHPDDVEIDTRVFDPTNGDALVQVHKSDRMTEFPFARASGSWSPLNSEFFEAQRSDTTTQGKQISKSENPAFFHPRLDNSIAHKQLQVGLAGEKMSQTIASLSAVHMERIIADERSAMDFEVRRLQVTLAETYLTSPISGLVTAVFKEVGECVQAGEPVLRIEDDTVVFLAGRIQYFGILRVGQTVTVKADDLYEANEDADITGTIRGIRGHQADDDEWEVLIECDNPLSKDGNRRLPIYYQFDRDTTSIEVP